MESNSTNEKKTALSSNKKKQISFLLFSLLCLAPFAAKAQLTPVPSEFHGEWFFERAEIQEGSADNPQSYYTPRPISKEELSQKPHLMDVPVEVTFPGGFSAFVLTHKRRENLFANTNANVLEFRKAYSREAQDGMQAPTAEEMEKYPVLMNFFNMKSSGDLMSMQYFYSYRKDNTSDNNTEGVITIYYINPIKY